MNKNSPSCCGQKSNDQAKTRYEDIRIESAKNICGLGENYVERQNSKPVAVMCCQGACLWGDIARQAANIFCHILAAEKTVRICLGGALTKNTGQRNLGRTAPRLIALEGCVVTCFSRMMHGVIQRLEQEVVIADRLYDFDRNLFGIEEMPPEEARPHAITVATKIAATL